MLVSTFLDRGKLNFRFFVAVKEQDKKLHQEIIRIRDNINFKIGLLLAAKTGVCTPLAESEKIEASLIKKYERINPTAINIRAEYMEI